MFLISPVLKDLLKENKVVNAGENGTKEEVACMLVRLHTADCLRVLIISVDFLMISEFT